jgi:transporter family-2 protein
LGATTIFYTALGFAAGVALAIQPNINAQVARALTSPFVASMVSFGVSTLIMLVVGLLVHGRQIPLPGIAALPWLLPLAGGLMGAIFVTSSLYLAPIIGVGAVFALVIAGQVIGAALIDHFGLFGVTVRELTAGRLAGFGLVVAGALMVRFL